MTLADEFMAISKAIDRNPPMIVEVTWKWYEWLKFWRWRKRRRVAKFINWVVWHKTQEKIRELILYGSTTVEVPPSKEA